MDLEDQTLIFEAHTLALLAESFDEKKHYQQAIDKHSRAAEKYSLTIKQSSYRDVKKVLEQFRDFHIDRVHAIKVLLGDSTAERSELKNNNQQEDNNNTSIMNSVELESLMIRLQEIVEESKRASNTVKDIKNILEIITRKEEEEDDAYNRKKVSLIHLLSSNEVITDTIKSEIITFIQEHQNNNNQNVSILSSKVQFALENINKLHEHINTTHNNIMIRNHDNQHHSIGPAERICLLEDELKVLKEDLEKEKYTVKRQTKIIRQHEQRWHELKEAARAKKRLSVNP